MAKGGLSGLVDTLESFRKTMDSMKPTSLGEGLGALKLNTTKGMAQTSSAFGPEMMHALKVATPLIGLQEAMTDKHGGLSGVARKTIGSSATEAAGGIGGALGDVGGGLMKTGNPYAMAAGAALKLGGAMLAIPDQIKKWGDALHESNRQFADLSESMASVMAQDDARRIFLEREQGERRAGSAKELADARFRLDSAMAPIEDAFANLKNNVISKFTDVLANAVNHIKKYLPGGEENEDDIMKKYNWNWTVGGKNADSIDSDEETRRRRPRRMR